LEAKDAGDVYRLFDIVSPDEMAGRVQALLGDPRSSPATAAALAYGNQLFGTQHAPGVRLGVAALRTVVPESTAVAVLTTYWRALEASIQPTT
jgi:hypothetical protein